MKFAAEKFAALLNYFHPDKTKYNLYLDGHRIQKTIADVDIDVNQKFVQAGLLMFGVNSVRI